jgi:hypothetical protein
VNRRVFVATGSPHRRRRATDTRRRDGSRDERDRLPHVSLLDAVIIELHPLMVPELAAL